MVQVLSFMLSAIGAVGGIVLFHNLIRQRLRDRALGQLFGFGDHDRVFIVCSTQGDIGQAGVPTTYEDAMAQATLQTRFAERGIHYSVKLHTELTTNEKEGHLVLIGGPVANSVTRDLLARETVGLRYNFRPKGEWWVIVRCHNGKTVHSDPVLGEEDYGIVAKLRNPWSRSQSPTFIYLVAGVYGLGTWGAVHHLVNRTRHLKSRYKVDHETNFRHGFWAIIKSEGRQGQAPDTEVLETQAP